MGVLWSLPRSHRVNILFWYVQSRFRYRVTRRSALVYGLLRSTRACLLITGDIWSPLDRRLVSQLPDLRTISLQLGVFLPRHLPRLAKRHQPAFDLIALWGNWHHRLLLAAGVRAREVAIVGSLRASQFERQDANRRKPDRAEAPEIVAVVFKPLNSASSFSNDYRVEQLCSRVWLLTYLRRLSADLGIRVSFLSQYASSASRAWHRCVTREFFGADAQFVGGDESLSSYHYAYSANLLVGDTSSLLFEALSRRKKVLSVTFSSDPSMQFPVPGLWQMAHPTYEQFRARVKQVLSMDSSEWASVVVSHAEELCFAGGDAQDRVVKMALKVLADQSTVARTETAKSSP